MPESNKNITRNISIGDGLALIIGLMLGVGIYQTPSIIAGAVGGELELYLMWLLGGFLTLCGALCYTELASTYPKQGGDYFFLSRAYGPIVGYLYGWANLVIIRPGSIAAVAFTFASYFKATFSDSNSEEVHVPLAIIAVLSLSLINILGARLKLTTQKVLAFLSYIILLILAIAGYFYFNIDNSTVSSFHDYSDSTNYGLALILVLFCFGGWSELSLVSGEVKNPKKNFLGTMLLGTTLITILYCIVNFALCSILSFETLRTASSPVSSAVSIIGDKFAPFISLTISICALSSLSALIFAGARISFAFGCDHKKFSYLGSWDKISNCPKPAIAVQTILSVFMILITGSFVNVLVYTTAVVWIYYLLVGISLFILRKKDKHIPRVYSVWGYPIIPIIFCLSAIFLIQSSFVYDLTGTIITIVVTASGMIFYEKNN